MMTKNPAPIPIANSVSNMIDPRTAPPRRDALSVSILATSWLDAGVLPLGLLEPYLRLTTLLASVPSTIESRCGATAAMILGSRTRTAAFTFFPLLISSQNRRQEFNSPGARPYIFKWFQLDCRDPAFITRN